VQSSDAAGLHYVPKTLHEAYEQERLKEQLINRAKEELLIKKAQEGTIFEAAPEKKNEKGTASKGDKPKKS